MKKSTRRLTIEYIKSEFLKKGCTLLSDHYINNKIKMDYICDCGNLSKVTWNHFKKGVRCNKCAIEKRRNKIIGHPTNDNVRIRVAEANKRRIWTKEMKLKMSKSLRNPNITDDEREKRKNERWGTYDSKLIKWRDSVYTRDNNMCQICRDSGNRKNLTAHHKNNWARFPEERYDINNGVILCIKHHKEFHKRYGKYLTTNDQFEEFKDEKNGKEININRKISKSYA